MCGCDKSERGDPKSTREDPNVGSEEEEEEGRGKGDKVYGRNKYVYNYVMLLLMLRLDCELLPPIGIGDRLCVLTNVSVCRYGKNCRPLSWERLNKAR